MKNGSAFEGLKNKRQHIEMAVLAEDTGVKSEPGPKASPFKGDGGE